MEDVTYPSITPSNDGWKVKVSAGCSLPGFYTSLRIAQQALRSYEIQSEVIKAAKLAKKKTTKEK